MPEIKVGCCGFQRGMKDYFSRFRLVEVQQTFYKMPKLETALKWRQQAPPDFEFTLKAWQVITHPAASPTYRKSGLKIRPGREKDYGFFVPSDEVLWGWEETQRFARALEARTIVFQCPPSLRETAENVVNLRRFFKSAGGSGFLLVWEPRGEWGDSTARALCLELGLVHCVDPMIRQPLAGSPQYFRLHGGPGYQHSHTQEELRRLRDGIGDRDTYVLFNNLSMYDDALAFERLVNKGG